MPRYLTPAKICLLILVDLHISDEIPSSSKLDVLSFISSQTIPPSDHDEQALEARLQFPSSDISIFADKLSQCESGVPGRKVYDVLLQRIWKLDDPDALQQFFNQMSEIVLPSDPDSQEPVVPKVSRVSPLGQYIRRCAVEFTRLPFEGTQALWDAFAAYRAPSYLTWASRNPEAAKQQVDDRPSWTWPARSQPTSSGFASSDDTATLLNYSIFQLQKLGARVSDPVKATLSQWLSDLTSSDSPDESLQHFLQFFEYWRSGQYTMAVESLHRYFDYSISRNSSSGPGGQDNMRVYYQYALLHLSVLHADFERWSESVDTMEECIATARENQDTACLNFALSWLMYLRQAHPNSSASNFGRLLKVVGGDGNGEDDEIAFLRRKAIEGRNWSLLSSTLLEEAKKEMHTNGSSVRAFQHILEAQHKAVQHDLRTLTPASTLFHSASLDRLGLSTLSDQLYSSVNILHRQHCPLNDRVRVNCRLAYNFAQSGQYDGATDLLNRIESTAKGVLKLQQRVQAFKALVQLKKCIRKGDMDAANHFLEYLTPMREFGDPEIQFEISLLEIELLIKKQEYPTASKLVSKQIVEFEPKNHSKGADIAQRLHLMVMKARIYVFSGEIQALKGFSLAIRAAATAHRLGLVSVMTEAMGILGAILNTLGEFEAAGEVIRFVLPSALENRDLYVRAELYQHLTEACVGAASNREMSSGRRITFLEIAMKNARKAFDTYSEVADTSGMMSCLLVEGQIADLLGDEDTAEYAKNEYLDLQDEFHDHQRKRKEKVGL